MYSGGAHTASNPATTPLSFDLEGGHLRTNILCRPLICKGGQYTGVCDENSAQIASKELPPNGAER
ncbi:uncharacterized protein Nmag_3056 [Natrialba magadii ATCC 43099]|uniref:Uncharacterized protein n=1 Tax=Natrialba magadii (strain ATCC 43099 / DSM 3394 / CCM 3739 / CIP 104546 / IAM 13178 / JCM 8861 / NBRC 102185 / NCIMB 2190 / MS3) TaxID=547559 RepID=D3SR52_NATMM|nr:uncharacterized protein Nmag_3056 [Natrialba magadii ATCC 43099]